MSEAELVALAKELWDKGDVNAAANVVSELRGIVGERGAEVRQDGDGTVSIVEAGTQDPPAT